MSSLASVLIALSASVVGLLGLIHLYYTLGSDKFSPRDPGLKTRLEETSPVLSSRIIMWKAWIGFNVSHGLGLLLFSAAYGYLALFRATVLFTSPYLLAVGGLVLLTYLVLAKVYWYSAPFRLVAFALLLYVTAIVMAVASGAGIARRARAPTTPNNTSATTNDTSIPRS